ncbi:hypothetical protein D3C71_1472450 [compost metagenome]
MPGTGCGIGICPVTACAAHGAGTASPSRIHTVTPKASARCWRMSTRTISQRCAWRWMPTFAARARPIPPSSVPATPTGSGAGCWTAAAWSPARPTASRCAWSVPTPTSRPRSRWKPSCASSRCTCAKPSGSPAWAVGRGIRRRASSGGRPSSGRCWRPVTHRCTAAATGCASWSRTPAAGCAAPGAGCGAMARRPRWSWSWSVVRARCTCACGCSR